LSRSQRSNPLYENALAFLDAVYDSERALFPFTTSLVGDSYASTFRGPGTIRYSINCLVGLKQAEERGGSGLLTSDVDRLIQAFTRRHYPSVTNLADLGLLLVLGEALEPSVVDATLESAEAAVRAGRLTRFTIQELSWLLWGIVSLVRIDVARALPLAKSIFKVLREDFLDHDSLLPRHSPRLYRRNLVSFGGIVYFFKALHEYARCFDDEYARTLFRFGVERLLDLQGPHGEWPWLINVRSGRAVEPYPLFSVHQDSMAMLFLLPALDADYPGAREAIERSYAWVMGNNELNQAMIVSRPFFRYRSIERLGPVQKPRRYVRSLVATVARNDHLARRGARVRVNEECRSYEMGWIVYSWAGRSERLAVVPGERAIEFPRDAAPLEAN